MQHGLSRGLGAVPAVSFGSTGRLLVLQTPAASGYSFGHSTPGGSGHTSEAGFTHAPLGTGEISSMFSRSALNRQKGSTGPPLVGKPLTSLGTRSLRADRCAPPEAPAGQGRPPAEGGARSFSSRVQDRNVVSHCPKASSSRQTFTPATFIAIIANIRVF